MSSDLETRLRTAFGAEVGPLHRAWLDRRMTTALAHEAAPSRRRRRLVRSLVLVVAMLIVAPTLFVVGATILSTEAPYGMGNAATYEAELREAEAVTPIPPGATWPPYLSQAPDPNASYGTGLGREMVEYNAYCLWLGYWYDAQASGDAHAGAAAVAALDQARTWRSFTDPQTSDEGFRRHTRETIDAVVAGEAPVVLHELQVNCSGTRDR